MTQGEPLTVEQISELPDGAEVVVTWSGGNGPHPYRVLVDKYGTRRVETVYADALLDNPDRPVPPHRVTLGWSDADRERVADRYVSDRAREIWAQYRGHDD